MKKLTFILLVFGIFLHACVDNWENRFNQDTADQTVWESISGSQEYASFAALLSETGYDSILDRSSVYTVLIPPAASLEAFNELDTAEKAQLVAYHISNSILYSTDFKDVVNLKSLNGKQIIIEDKSGIITLNQEIGFLKNDIKASNGVIHEIDAALEIRPNLIELLEANSEFSYILDLIQQGTEVLFDEENSVQIGLDSIGRNVYDSVWISNSDFFDRYARLNSEDNAYTLFLADNTLLDTEEDGSLMGGYLATFPRYILDGINYAENLNEQMTAVNGLNLAVNPANLEFYANASNGIVYKISTLEGLPIPTTTIWEFTDISDFDDVRGISTTDYLETYNELEALKVLDLDGGFTEFKYEKKSGTYNGDYLRIKTSPGTDVTLEFDLADLQVAKYRVSINALIRVVDGVRYEAYLNDVLISSGNDFNGGLYKFEEREIGEINIEKEKGNVFRMVIDGTSSSTVFCHIDYLKFEPIK